MLSPGQCVALDPYVVHCAPQLRRSLHWLSVRQRVDGRLEARTHHFQGTTHWLPSLHSISDPQELSARLMDVCLQYHSADCH